MYTRIAIITPTIGRPSLRRCVESVMAQISHIHRHIVVGDGPQEPWVKSFCESRGVLYHELPTKQGDFGAHARNFALDFVENNLKPDYIVFLDDDNELLMSYTYNIDETARLNNNPPLLYQPILHSGKFDTFYKILPATDEIPSNGDWDSLNGIFRSDIIKGVRWEKEYNHDFKFALDAKELAGTNYIKVKGINAIHHVSWDTYDAAVKG